MKQPWHEDPTRRHAFVTAGLAAVAALVLLVLDDPASTAAAGKAPYRQFDASARPVRPQPGERGPVIRPAVMGSATPMLPRKK